jgi:hypothetical protein
MEIFSYFVCLVNLLISVSVWCMSDRFLRAREITHTGFILVHPRWANPVLTNLWDFPLWCSAQNLLPDTYFFDHYRTKYTFVFLSLNRLTLLLFFTWKDFYTITQSNMKDRLEKLQMRMMICLEFGFTTRVRVWWLAS